MKIISCLFPGGDAKRAATGFFTGGLSEVVRGGSKLFSPKSPAGAAVTTPVDRDDPSITAAKEKLRLSERKRKGRRAAILTPPSGVNGENTIIKRTAALGGNSDKLS